MSDPSIEIRTRAMEFLKQQELSPDTQTRICLFLQGVKSINATILSRVEFQPMDWVPYKFLHSQCYKEVELTTLLGKSTTWSSNPLIFLAATQLNLSLWQETGAARYMGGMLKVDRNFYEYLALSHAFLSVIRILPLLSVQISLDTPFLSALKEIEEENGRQIQTQIRLLKDMAIELSLDEKENIIESQRQIVERLFLRLLDEITETRVAA
ncbi:hypothetical protein [Noviherbaspirillum sedimenti]|uniref:Uncharacterized protein n=1 Tax=Noviherbaspirillum sedimenti TaxID=2320865 RepID=A0A3A3FYD2_9BURK|nr:hypothetical protein [Noviherbaspirillum sedimenti]RJG01228.1 hypothetical protein D3878_06215 [Noviherbaspirillum sedimenti]